MQKTVTFTNDDPTYARLRIGGWWYSASSGGSWYVSSHKTGVTVCSDGGNWYPSDYDKSEWVPNDRSAAYMNRVCKALEEVAGMEERCLWEPSMRFTVPV